MPTRIDSCPSCQGDLLIRELYCPSCDIQIRGEFQDSPAKSGPSLTGEQEAFLRLFVLSRGNLSDVERSLGVSYPTVRAKLDDLIAAFGDDAPTTEPAPATAEPTMTRSEVLAAIREGRLSVDDGMAWLKRLEQ